jgi:DNA polymerase-3 subunit gamma/tau
MFILATTEVQKVPATILSRCQRFDFKRIPEDMIAERVRYVAVQEGISVTEEASSLIARLSDGALRDALSLLDTCASLDTNVDEEVVKRLAGVTDREYLFDLADRIRDRDITGALGIVSELYNNSMDPVRLLPEMIRHYRNLLMVRVGQVTLNDCSSAMQKRYEEVSREYDETEILDCLDVLSDASDRMSRSLDREITLELAVISLAGGRTGRQVSGPVRKMEAKIERRETKKEGNKQTAPQSTAKPNEPDIPVPEVTSKEVPADSTASPESENSDTKEVAEESREKLLDRWDDCVAEIKERNRTLGALLKSSAAHITDTHLLIEANPMAIKFIRDNEESRTIIKEAVALVTGLKLPVGPWHGNSDKKETKDDDGFEEFLRKAMEAGVEVERE